MKLFFSCLAIGLFMSLGALTADIMFHSDFGWSGGVRRYNWKVAESRALLRPVAVVSGSLCGLGILSIARGVFRNRDMVRRSWMAARVSQQGVRVVELVAVITIAALGAWIAFDVWRSFMEEYGEPPWSIPSRQWLVRLVSVIVGAVMGLAFWQWCDTRCRRQAGVSGKSRK